ncbi:MAG: TonB-dependent receptor [Alphaproteobacteria bacterium]|nr:TonB-dependent receptor [Alphaproteobacteria bacterium]
MGRTTRFLLGAGVSALATTAAWAQDSEITDVITVTTQFREQSLADVPINVSAFDEQRLDELNIADFEDLALYTPGLIVQEQSPNNTGYSIRGITSDSGEATSETRVAVFQDGVSITRSRGSYIELFDIERVEVAKGPQPTLFGRGALIGGINIIQNKAEDEFSAAGELGFGNEGQFEAEGYVNYGFGNGYGVRLAAVHRQRDGYIENTEGGDLQGRDTWAARFVFSGQPSDRLSFDFIANYQEDTPPGTSFKSGSIPAVGGDTNPFTAASLNTFGNFLGGRELGLDRSVYGATLLVDYDINDAWSLNSITGWREFDSVEVFDPEGTALPMFVFAEDATGEQISQEFRLNYDAGGRLTGSAGFTYFHETGTQLVPLGISELYAQVLLAPTLAAANGTDIATLEFLLGADIDDLSNPFPFSIAALLGQNAQVPLRDFYQEDTSNSAVNSSYDLFADASYEVTDRLTVTAGLRYTYEDKKSQAQSWNTAGTNLITFTPTLIIPATPQGNPVAFSDEFDDVTWRLAASYEVNDDLNTWISFARGRRPDVISADSSQPSFFTVAPAEIVDSLEAGFFWTLPNGQISGSVYRSEYENFQSSRFDPNQVTFVVDNAGNATQVGAEIDAFYEFTDRFEGFVNYAYSDATFDDTDSNGNAQQLAGNTFRYSPEHSVALGINFELMNNDNGTLVFSPNYTWQSEIFFDEDNDRLGGLLTQDSYGLLNTTLRWEDAQGRYHAELYGTNLTDEEYLIDAGNTGGSFGIPTFIAGAPALYGVRVGVSY